MSQHTLWNAIVAGSSLYHPTTTLVPRSFWNKPEKNNFYSMEFCEEVYRTTYDSCHSTLLCGRESPCVAFTLCFFITVFLSLSNWLWVCLTWRTYKSPLSYCHDIFNSLVGNPTFNEDAYCVHTVSWTFSEKVDKTPLLALLLLQCAPWNHELSS